MDKAKDKQADVTMNPDAIMSNLVKGMFSNKKNGSVKSQTGANKNNVFNSEVELLPPKN